MTPDLAESSWLCVVDTEGQKRLDCKMPNDPQRNLSHLKRFVPSLQTLARMCAGFTSEPFESLIITPRGARFRKRV